MLMEARGSQGSASREDKSSGVAVCRSTRGMLSWGIEVAIDAKAREKIMTTKIDWTVMKDCGQELAEKIMAVVCDKTLDEDQAAAQAGNLYAAARGGKPLFASLAMIVVGFEQMASPGLDFLEGLPDGELKAGLRRFIRITNAIPIPAMHAAIAEEHPQRAANLLRRLDSGSILSAWRDSGVVGGISWWGWRGSVSPNMIFAHCWYDASGSLSMENRYSLALLAEAEGLGSWATRPMPKASGEWRPPTR